VNPGRFAFEVVIKFAGALIAAGSAGGLLSIAGDRGDALPAWLGWSFVAILGVVVVMTLGVFVLEPTMRECSRRLKSTSWREITGAALKELSSRYGVRPQ
jgi:hypothetical protein